MSVPRLDWNLVGILGATGAIPATLGLFGLFPAPVEFAIWAALGILWIVALHTREAPHPFYSGLGVGLTSGVLTALIQGSLVKVYFDNHPAYQRDVAGQPLWQQGLLFAAFSLLAGLLQGAIVGLIAWILRRTIPRPDGPAAPTGQADRGKG